MSSSIPPQQIQYVNNFEDFVATPFKDAINAICWTRDLAGDFGEIVEKLTVNGNITEIEPADLFELDLTGPGKIARDILLNDLNLLKAHGASPVLNVIEYYETDDAYPFFPTDVYSFHVDRAPIPADTILCTYYGAPSEILPNEQGQHKIQIPEIRAELRKLYQGAEDGFDSFLAEHFFDLHYQAKADAQPINLGAGNLWRLVCDYPDSPVLPCLHRAPKEAGKKRLLLIC